MYVANQSLDIVKKGPSTYASHKLHIKDLITQYGTMKYIDYIL